MTATFAFPLVASPRAPSQARRLVGARLEGAVADTALETARLLVSELTTNCTQHGDDAYGGMIELNGTLLPEHVHVEVWGRGPRFEAAVRHPDDHEEGGRGLLLVDALSTRWGVDHHRGETCVWFEIARG